MHIDIYFSRGNILKAIYSKCHKNNRMVISTNVKSKITLGLVIYYFLFILNIKWIVSTFLKLNFRSDKVHLA